MSELIKPDYETLIFNFRGYKVMVDSDLALLYDVSTKALKQQVKRNSARFPEDFMFELTEKEKHGLVTNCDRLSKLKHSTTCPMVFTEQGVAMLSSVLRSERAIKINIEIMRAFSRYRSLLKETEELKIEITSLDAKLNSVFKLLLEKIDEMNQTRNKPANPIGYKTRKTD